MSEIVVTEAVIKKALRDVRIHHLPYPDIYAWSKAPIPPEFKNIDDFKKKWPKLPLLTRLGMVAVFIGRSYSPEPNRIITTCYLSLCYSGKLPETIHAAP